MSAFLVSKAHIDVLVSLREKSAWTFGAFRYLNPDELGRALWRENMLSLQARYGDPVNEALIDSYRYEAPKKERTAAELIKAVHCYDYQSCEHDEWPTCEARRYCLERIDCLIGDVPLPGYDAAAWSIQ